VKNEDREGHGKVLLVNPELVFSFYVLTSRRQLFFSSGDGLAAISDGIYLEEEEGGGGGHCGRTKIREQVKKSAR
jgi:hypothetical protein